MDIFRQYKLILVIKIINSTVLNKLQSYSRISSLGPEGQVIVLTISRERCVFHVDRMWTPTRGKGVRLMWTQGGQKFDFCGHHKWMAPYIPGRIELYLSWAHMQLGVVFRFFSRRNKSNSFLLWKPINAYNKYPQINAWNPWNSDHFWHLFLATFLVVVNFWLLKRHSKAKTRASAYSRALFGVICSKWSSIPNLAWRFWFTYRW